MMARMIRAAAALLLVSLFGAPAPAQEARAPTPTADPRLDDLARALRLSEEQRALVAKIAAAGQAEFERRIAREPATVEDLERLSAEMAKKTQVEIMKVLDPMQRAAFEKMIRAQESGEDDDEDAHQLPEPRRPAGAGK